MNHLAIPRLDLGAAPSMPAIAEALRSSGACVLVEHVQWATPKQVPKACVYVAHRRDHLMVHWVVSEYEMVALSGADHGTVWMDSCVESFLQPPGSADYYNIETNAIGSVLMACGPNRGGSIRLPLTALKGIRREASMGRTPIEPTAGPVSWTLTLDIPRAAFVHHPGRFDSETWRGNFYKCGDGQRDPHWLTWNRIDVADGDFHRPEHFGTLTFLS